MEFVPILIVGGVIGGLIFLCVLFYLFSCMSRKSYRCPHCGEAVSTEYLNAKHCNMCGASLDEE